MKTANYEMQVGPTGLSPRWVLLGGRRMAVQAVLREWDEPAAPWEGVCERHYVRLMLLSGGVLEAYQENGIWAMDGVED